jgi:hypothetical protein
MNNIPEEILIKSITYGKKSGHQKTRIQALCAPLTSTTQLEALLQHLSKEPKLANVTDKILAFRTAEEEGFDDGNALGAGEKLLQMMERMNVDNIVVMLFLWDYGHFGKSGNAVYKMILDQARELLINIHQQIFNTNSAVTLKPSKSQSSSARCFSFDNLTTPSMGRLKTATANTPEIRDSSEASQEVSEAEVAAAVNQVETSLRAITQKDLIELRACASHPLIHKILQLVSLIKGSKTWQSAKDVLSSRTLKYELISFDVLRITPSQAKMAHNFIRDNELRIAKLQRVSPVAASLLSWVEGILVMYSGKEHIPKSLATTPARSYTELLAQHTLPVREPPPELMEKLNFSRELKKSQEEKIERVLSLRLKEMNFADKLPELSDEDILRYLNSENLEGESNDMLLAIAENLKKGRLDRS